MTRGSVLASFIALFGFSGVAAQAETPAPLYAPHLERREEEEESEPEDRHSLEVAYTADIWALASGGRERGIRYLDNLDLVASTDLEDLVGLPRTTALLYLLYNNGTRFSETLVGDAQAVSNIETGTRAFRLYEAWIEHALSDRASIKVGLYDLNSEFDALESSSLFLGSAHGIGTDISQSGRNGPSIFPVTSLAARVQLKLADGWLVRTAILDGVPGDPDRPRRTTISLGGGDGALLIGEVERTVGAGRLLFGHWRYTGKFEDRLATSTSGGPVRGRGNQGFYLRGEAALDEKSFAFARLGSARARYNDFSFFTAAGLVRKGLLPGRPEDQAGVAIAWAEAGSNFRKAEEIEGRALDQREIAVEFTYRLELSEFVAVQSDVQYVVNPGLDPGIRDALTLGLRLEFRHRI